MVVKGDCALGFENTRNEAVTATGTAQCVAQKRHASPRLSIRITNTGAAGDILSISLGEPGASLAGIVLVEPGSFYEDKVAAGYWPYQGEYWVIGNGAACLAAVAERG